MKISNREKRDWGLLIFIVPIGIFLMVVAGKIAVRIVPIWSVTADMGSSLDVETAPKQQVGFIQPILPEILTPLSWFDTFLTPGADSGGDIEFPPFVVFEPTFTPSPSPSASPTLPPTATETPTATVVPPSPTVVITKTKKPPVDDTSTPPTSTATATATATTTATATATATSTATATATATATPIVTPQGTAITVTPVGITIGTPDDVTGIVPAGYYISLDLGVNPIIVNGPSDTNYDFVYYELYRLATNDIAMDSVILSISIDNINFYEVFNWGDGIPDTNSNVGVVSSTSGTEDDNQPISSADADLYGSPPLQTGILIDVDSASSAPPLGSYQYLAIQAPTTPNTDLGTEIDSIVVTEVPVPTPTP